jgi:pilus assembly protein CpaF
MILSANAGLPLNAIREQMSSAIQLVVQQVRLPDGRRVVHDVTEIVGLESGCIQMQTLARFDAQTGRAGPCGIVPQCFERWGREVESELLRWFGAL